MIPMVGQTVWIVCPWQPGWPVAPRQVSAVEHHQDYAYCIFEDGSKVESEFAFMTPEGAEEERGRQKVLKDSSTTC